jgi:protein-S-isoprenylcysteine O-methyltransferase Ste14
MSPWFGYAAFVVGNAAGVVIRVPHETRSKQVRVVEDRKGAVEEALLAVLTVALLLPLLTMTTSILGFADYPLHPGSFVVGTVFMGLYLCCFTAPTRTSVTTGRSRSRCGRATAS